MREGGLQFFAKELNKRTEEDFDSILIVESGAVKGTGKTTFSIGLCKEICKLLGIPYDIKKLMILDATEDKIRKLARELSRGVPIHVDEAIFLAYKRDYNEDATKKFVKFVNICRKFGHPVILNVPWFWDLDKDIRNLADYRVTIVKRGIALVRQKDINTDTEDLWLRKDSGEIQAKEIGYDMTDIQGIIRGVTKCKNLLFKLSFAKLREEEYEIYKQLSLSEEGKQLEQPDQRKRDVWFKVLAWYHLKRCKEKGMTIASLVGELNELIAKSGYAMQFDKYALSSTTLKIYAEEFEKTMLLVSAINNNSKITSGEEEGEAAKPPLEA